MPYMLLLENVYVSPKIYMDQVGVIISTSVNFSSKKKVRGLLADSIMLACLE
ncbi:hypothetical protein MtrunA17_Chr3g0126441 [Medicago truncatula]|uniref:Uncharacterized protein n=1 Tax=Medicago truncatula TaxID=3880 RepID=A0A396IV57_MEDTR|nr:hypothetical protein MtrunA17_Chr3g0126441 [Medicago truncatula]